MKINIKNTAKIEAAIKAAEGRATSFTLDASRIQRTARYADNKLGSLHILKPLQIGTRVDLYPELPANAYKWRPSGTFATIQRYPSGWFLVGIARGITSTCSGGRPAEARMIITAEAQQSLPRGWTL